VKKLLLLPALVISLTLCFTTITMAAVETPTVYVDTMISGTVDDSDILGDGDAHETYIGFELPVDKFKINLELLTGRWDQDGYDNNDLSGYDLKGGYQIIKDQDLQLYATLSNYSRELDSDQQFSGILLGADAVCNLSKKMNVEGSVGFSVSGKYEEPDNHYYENASLLHFKAKLNYLITKEVSASLGYRYYGFKLDHSDVEVNSKGLTLGVNLKF
jgi:opacity protein-like surface antigen